MTLPIANQTWLIATATGANPTILTTASYPLITDWSSTVTYQRGAIVTGPDALQYQAAALNTDVTPPAPDTWTRSAYTSPDKGMLAQSAVPLPFIPQWDPATVFQPGQQVVHLYNTFVTPAGCQGIAPPPTPGNNTAWEYVGSAQAGMLASFYVAGGGGVLTDVDVYAGIEWYDQGGALIAAPSGLSSAATTIGLPVFAHLYADTPEMNATNDNTLGLEWSASPTGYWQISAGMLSGSLTYEGSQAVKLLTVTDSRADCCVGITAQTEVPNPATGDVGVVFRLSDSNNYWLCSRSSIQKMVAGTLSTAASYTRLPVGSRFYVQLSGEVIAMYAYPGDGGAPVQITRIEDTFNATASVHGLYQQVI